MPNNIIVDVSQINAAISDINNLKAGLTKGGFISALGISLSTAPVDPAVATLKLWTKRYNLATDGFAGAKGNTYSRIKAVSFAPVGFSTPPVVFVNLSGTEVQMITQSQSVTNTGCHIIVQKIDGKKWGTNDAANITVNVLAIGY